MTNKSSVDYFYHLSKRVLGTRTVTALTLESSFDEKVGFHKVHNRFLELASSKEYDLLLTRYPFVKLSGKWKVNVVAYWLYLQAARGIMAKTENIKLGAIHDAVTASQRYIEESKQIWERMSPSTWENMEEYQAELKTRFEILNIQQSSIFDAID
jgi:hypothetical protein